MNTFAKKLYKLELGKSLTLKKKDGTVDGVFTRVPSGWIYRYSMRNSTCCCFIPYSEEIYYWDIDLPIKSCPFCTSTNVFLIPVENGNNKKYKISCEDCGASIREYEDKSKAIAIWNSLQITVQ